MVASVHSPQRGRFARDGRRIAGLLRPEWRAYTAGLSALFLVNLADVVAPLFMAVAVDLTVADFTGNTPDTPPVFRLVGLESGVFSLLGAVALYLALQLLANLARYPMLMFTAVPSHRIGQTLRNRLVGHLLRLSRPFYDRAKSGDLMSLATADVQAVRMMVGPGVLVGSDTVFIFSLVLGVLLSLSWSLTLITMVPLPFIFWFTNRMSHREYDCFAAVQESIAGLTERARESYAGIRIIQGYAIEDFDRRRFGEQSWAHYVKNLALARVRALFDPTLDAMLDASKVLVLTFGGLQVATGQMSLGSFVAFLFLVGYLAGPMIGFGWSVSLFQRGRASLERLEAQLAVAVDIADAPGACDAEGPGRIEVRDLTFAYADEPVLRSVTLTVDAGSTLGVIGPVGSGKSTLASLLVRLYDPPAGTVFLDDLDVRGLRLASLREQIVVAPQDTFLFSTTVARNILLAAGATDLSADSFASLAQVHEEIDALPRGYDTLLGERGMNLSGGQRQRVAIARALATDPRVLVLDDCLSAVDASTEEAILGALRAVLAGRTGLIISHRVRAVALCDQVVVLEDGRITQRGTPDELLLQPGYYADIAAQQMMAGP